MGEGELTLDADAYRAVYLWIARCNLVYRSTYTMDMEMDSFSFYVIVLHLTSRPVNKCTAIKNFYAGNFDVLKMSFRPSIHLKLGQIIQICYIQRFRLKRHQHLDLILYEFMPNLIYIEDKY